MTLSGLNVSLNIINSSKTLMLPNSQIPIDGIDSLIDRQQALSSVQFENI